MGSTKSTPSTPHWPIDTLFFYEYNHSFQGKRVGKCRKKLEKNRKSFQECFEKKISLKQTLLFKVPKLLKVEKSFRFNSPFIIFGTKTWKIFTLKFFLNQNSSSQILKVLKVEKIILILFTLHHLYNLGLELFCHQPIHTKTQFWEF